MPVLSYSRWEQQIRIVPGGLAHRLTVNKYCFLSRISAEVVEMTWQILTIDTRNKSIGSWSEGRKRRGEHVVAVVWIR